VLVFWLAAHTQQKFEKNVKKVLKLHAIACVYIASVLSFKCININYHAIQSMVVKSKKKMLLDSTTLTNTLTWQALLT
jgi:hypothetical protein